MNLTVPKLKDLVHAPSQKYEKIFSAMNNMNSINSLANDSSLKQDLDSVEGTYITHLGTESSPGPNPIDMKNELKQFMKKQFKETTIENANLSGNGNSSIQYSSY